MARKSHARSSSLSATTTKTLPLSAASRIVTHDSETNLYRIRWRGHTAADDSWRSHGDLERGAQQLLQDFERNQVPVNVRGDRALQIDPALEKWKRQRKHRRATKSVSFCELVDCCGEEGEAARVELRC